MRIKNEPFGELNDGMEITRYTVENSGGLSFQVITYGATITSVRMPDTYGTSDEITLGFEDLKDYVEKSPYFGATIGRYANRIEDGKFELDGHQYQLAKNENGRNHLHGGTKGFDKVVWEARPFEEKQRAGVIFYYTSADGEEGYPGNLFVTITMCLNELNELSFEYRATTDKKTPINLTNHTYWNLCKPGDASILEHELWLNAEHYLPVTDELLPTGEVCAVEGGPMDFTVRKKIGEDIDTVNDGFDHCFLIRKSAGTLREAAVVHEPNTGRYMKILTTKPGIQFYSGNFLDGIIGRHGKRYEKRGALCLETEFYPNSINHPSFPSVILHPGDIYEQRTIHRFYTAE